MARTPDKLALADGDREALEKIARTRTEQAQRVDRARTLLAKADGEGIDSIAARLGVNRNTVSLCVRKYREGGLGTVSLIAGIDLLDGHVTGIVRDRHRSREFIELLEALDARYPEGDVIRLVLDNHSIHRSKETRAWLEARPGRFELVFTPTHGSWLNVIEGFFGKMSRQVLRGIRVSSKQELVDRIGLYLDEVNADPVPHRWKWGIGSPGEDGEAA